MQATVSALLTVAFSLGLRTHGNSEKRISRGAPLNQEEN
jgi:hypothetical protein